MHSPLAKQKQTERAFRGTSKSALRRADERARTVVHEPKRGEVTTIGRMRYTTAPDGSFRRLEH